MRRLACTLVLAPVLMATAGAQREGFPPEEFAARREALIEPLDGGLVLLAGRTGSAPGLRFRQDNDFYYFAGNESPNAVLVIDVARHTSHLFLPTLTPAMIRYDGPNWLDESDAARAHGFTSVQPLSALMEFLARQRRTPGRERLWVRLSERDEVNRGRRDTAMAVSRRYANPLAQQPTEDASRVADLRARFPHYQIEDVTPAVDRLRILKSSREIATLRRNGRISAEAIVRAMRATRPGAYEYELEAEATHWMFKHGMQGWAYPAIVASGPMGNRWHYEDNGRRLGAGDLVVMDYGGSLDYLTMDITRTWPVSGRFTGRQRQAYDTVLDAQKAILAAIRPGVTRDAVRTLAEGIFRQHGFDPSYAYVGHYVGLSVHDVGDWDRAFEAGMVLAIEPMVDLPDKGLHVRIEDTVVVTSDGADVLTAGAPKEIAEVLRALMR